MWKNLIIITLISICISMQLSSGEPMKLIHLTDPEAICNDGSPAAYYYRPGDPDRWNIHQQGGAWCWDEQTCMQRWHDSPNLMSSKHWASNLTIGGLFSQDQHNNPDWYRATKVFIAYCSSDSFAGDRPASPMTYHFHFKGKAILRAVIHDLLAKGLANAHHVLFSGCSAGGSAVFANLDYVASLLPPLPQRVFRGHADAGFFLVTKPFTNIPAPYEVIFSKGQKLWNGIGNAACMKDMKEGEQWKCFAGQFVHPYLKTPILIWEEVEDQIQLWRNGASAPWDQGKLQYVEYFRGNMTRELEKVAAPHGVFGSACYWHCGTEEATFWDIKLRNDKVSDREVLGKWFFGHVEKNHFIDNCAGFNCSVSCPHN
eukprot:TRINITY_DN22231_c0_g1_i1.p1 TRINITY_DN22231_c0_g1~~TRINITY_DN22231_c0_g1_i1.p1  ORF type:complete len:371 (-),score=78.18 TRINITY_DN22231_c0_g1_i1:38-1150(-)